MTSPLHDLLVLGRALGLSAAGGNWTHQGPTSTKAMPFLCQARLQGACSRSMPQAMRPCCMHHVRHRSCFYHYNVSDFGISNAFGDLTYLTSFFQGERLPTISDDVSSGQLRYTRHPSSCIYLCLPKASKSFRGGFPFMMSQQRVHHPSRTVRHPKSSGQPVAALFHTVALAWHTFVWLWHFLSKRARFLPGFRGFGLYFRYMALFLAQYSVPSFTCG